MQPSSPAPRQAKSTFGYQTATYLFRRDDVWQYRRRVPLALVAKLAITEIRLCRVCTDFKTALAAADTLGLAYRPAADLATSRLEDLLTRIEQLARPIDILAHTVQRRSDRLPLYRQAQILAREGVQIDRSTLAHWVGFADLELAPLHEGLDTILTASTELFADETRCPLLDPGRGRTRPLVEALRYWLDGQLTRVSGRSPIAEAMRYGTSHWQSLCRFSTATTWHLRRVYPTNTARMASAYCAHFGENSPINSAIEHILLHGVFWSGLRMPIEKTSINLSPGSKYVANATQAAASL